MSIATKCMPSSRRALLSKITLHFASPASVAVFSFHQTARSQSHLLPCHQPVQAGGSICPASLKLDCAPTCGKWSPGQRCSDKVPTPACGAARVD